MSNYPSYPTTPPKKCEYCNGAGIIDPYGDEEDVAQADPRYPHETCWMCKGTGIQRPSVIMRPAINGFKSKWQELNKSGFDTCDCCTPMQQASVALLDSVFEKAEKPFHGYNPNRHSRSGGLNAKGRAKAKRETGANLKRPVTKKPSSLKPGSKAAKRRKSFCARMGGSKGPTSKEGKLTPKGAALKRWNC